jgi:[ribosomal protein S5]-alanine N-acetyltransferase
MLSSPQEMQFLRAMSRIDSGGWSEEDAMRRRVTQEETQQQNACWNCVATLKTGEFIGICGLRSIDQWNKSGEMGIILKHEYWGQGYSVEIHLAILGYAFESIGLNRITFVTSSKNAPMIKFCQNILRATHEGTLRDFFPIRSQAVPGVHNYESAELYTILQSEWESTKASLSERTQQDSL